jgi:hypothetical protein
MRKFSGVRFSAIVDSEEAITELGRAARQANLTLEIFLDLDCGMHRTGVTPGPEAGRLYRRISKHLVWFQADCMRTTDICTRRTSACEQRIAKLPSLPLSPFVMNSPDLD